MKLPLSKEEFYKIYQDRINKFAEECEWVTVINSDMVSGFVSKILSEYGVYIEPEKIDELYSNKIQSLNLTLEQWREEYASDIPKIIYLIYGEIELYLYETLKD
jgi:hypothetical protein